MKVCLNLTIGIVITYNVNIITIFSYFRTNGLVYYIIFAMFISGSVVSVTMTSISSMKKVSSGSIVVIIILSSYRQLFSIHNYLQVSSSIHASGNLFLS